MSPQYPCTDLRQHLDYLYALQRRGIKIGLDHSKRLLGRCGNPHLKFPAIHIAGTNGKGSTAAMIASILREAGFKTGLYTSPHLVRFNERIRVDGVPIADRDLAGFIKRYKPDIDEIESTFFETTSALAFWYFAKQEIDIAVVETGMGGRLDSTNVLDSKLSVITPISHDHSEYLGDTIAEIAAEKAGIIKNGKPVIVAPQDEEAWTVISGISQELESQLLPVDLRELDILDSGLNGSRFLWKKTECDLPLIGKHQLKNACTALEAVNCFDSSISIKCLTDGLKKVRWPGRLQALSMDPWIFYDVAHNAQGVSVIVDELTEIFPGKPPGVLALKKGKDISRLAPVLKREMGSLTVTSIPDSNLMDAEELLIGLKELDLQVKMTVPLQGALEWLKQEIPKSGAGLIFGTHYIAESIYAVFDFPFVNEAI